MDNKTAVMLLKETLDQEMKLGTKMVVNWDMYLQKERQQIEEAHQNGFYCGNDVANGLLPEHSSSSDYYNQTYTQNNQA